MKWYWIVLISYVGIGLLLSLFGQITSEKKYSFRVNLYGWVVFTFAYPYLFAKELFTK